MDKFNRKYLETKLKNSALDLFEETGSAAYVLPIPDTSPPLFIVVGTKEDIKKLLEE